MLLTLLQSQAPIVVITDQQQQVVQLVVMGKMGAR